MGRKRKPTPPISSALSFDEYQATEGVNWNTLKWLRVSPRHYEYNLRQPPEDRLTFMLGRAFHGLVLESDRFPLDFAVWTAGQRRGADWEAFKEAHRGRTIIKGEEYDEARAMRDAVLAHRDAARLLSKGESERTITWTDAASGLACKARIDKLRDDGIVDLKRTANLDPWRFERTAHDLGHHLQLAFYRRGVAALRGVENRSDVAVWIVAVEGSPPYDVAPFAYDPGALATADEEIDRLLALLVECRRKGRWPGRFEEVATLNLPAWAYGAEDTSTVEGIFDLNVSGEAA